MAKEEKMAKACPKCGSRDLETDATAMLWNLNASICRRCGDSGQYFELTEDAAKSLEDKYLKGKKAK